MPAVRALLEALTWWAACVAVWLISLSAFSYQDFLVAACCSLPCAAAAVAARHAVDGRWRFRPRLLVLAARLPAAIVLDAVHVLAVPFFRRRTRGRFRTVALGAAGTEAHASGRRAVVAALLSSTPGSYIVETDIEEGTGVVHTIIPPTRLQQAVGE